MKTRIIGPAGSCYHVFSRIIESRFYLGAVEKDVFVSMLQRAAEFSGVEILTYCIMDNHFHILVRVPERVDVNDGELLRRLKVLYGTGLRKSVHDPVGEFIRSEEYPHWREKLRVKYKRRMFNLSEFMRTLKLRYSFWYNKNHKREGTLWDMRFKSVLVQGDRLPSDTANANWALVMVAAYIDLNSVRAGIVDDPIDYKWCGYADAVRGSMWIKTGLCQLYAVCPDFKVSWRQIRDVYRSVLCQKAGDKMEQHVLLRKRVRYFTRGMVLGSKCFVNDVFEKNRNFFGSKRRSGARSMRGGNWQGLCVARDVGV